MSSTAFPGPLAVTFTVAGEIDAVAFAGRPDRLKVTGPVKPEVVFAWSWNSVAPPGLTVPVKTFEKRKKSGTGITVSETWTECCRLPLVPVTVSVCVPVGVLCPTLWTLNTTSPEPLTVTGALIWLPDRSVKDALVSWNVSVSVRVTVPVKPLTAPIWMVYFAVPPRSMVCDVGFAEIVKSGVDAARAGRGDATVATMARQTARIDMHRVRNINALLLPC